MNPERERRDSCAPLGPAIALSAALLLGACAEQAPSAGDDHASITHPAAAARAGAAASAPSAQAGASESAALTPPAAPAPAPELPTIEAETLLGKSAGEILSLLGEPQLKRREAAAEVWQYRGQDCVMDLVLYRQGEASKVQYLEARDRKKADVVEAQPCLDALLRVPDAKTG
ncbi:MAG: hypothetical protein ACREDZ_01790 [Kiloniellales bacterium]